MQVVPALRGEGFYIEENFGFRYFPTPNNFGQEKAAVLIIHGFPGDTSKNEDIATSLALHGYGLYIVHLKGLGESKGKFKYSEASNNIRKIAEFICKIHGVQKLHIIGHSFGGFCALSIKDVAESLVLLAPLVSLSTVAPLELLAKEFYSKHKDRLAYESEENLLEDLKVTSELFSQQSLMKGLEKVKTLLIHGTKDERISVDSSRKLKEKLSPLSSYLELNEDHKFSENRRALVSAIKQFFA